VTDITGGFPLTCPKCYSIFQNYGCVVKVFGREKNLNIDCCFDHICTKWRYKYWRGRIHQCRLQVILLDQNAWRKGN